MARLPVALAILLGAASIAFAPKCWTGVASPLLTTNTWAMGVTYEITDLNVHPTAISGTLRCAFIPDSSGPYFDGYFDPKPGTSALPEQIIFIEGLCEALPVDLITEGFPPREMYRGVRAPLFFGRII